ncbi:hypothetical protein KC356_g268 [Hortaea werneckii]|nr:hypothetical protein KC356_g268 [Hortaea werneckii]
MPLCTAVYSAETRAGLRPYLSSVLRAVFVCTRSVHAVLPLSLFGVVVSAPPFRCELSSFARVGFDFFAV